MAEQFDFPTAHCSISIPDGWMREPGLERWNPATLLAVSGEGQTKVVILLVQKVPHFFSVQNPTTKADLERDVQKHATILDASLVKLAGKDAYRILAHEKSGDTSVEVVTMAHGYMYMLGGKVKAGNAGKDAEIERIIASFTLDSVSDAKSDTSGATPVAEREVRFDSMQCSVLLPKIGWQRTEDERTPKGLLTITRADGALSLFLIVFPSPTPTNVRANVVIDSIRATMNRIGNIGEGHFIKLGGIDAYAVAGTRRNSSEQYFYNVSTLANNRFYVIMMVGNGVDPEKDPDLQAFLDNFAFIGTPRVAPE